MVKRNPFASDHVLLARELPTISLYNRSGGHGQTLFGNKVIGLSSSTFAKKLNKHDHA
jgi:hypothetical protein